MGKRKLQRKFGLATQQTANSRGKKYRNSARTRRAVVLHFRFRCCRCFQLGSPSPSHSTVSLSFRFRTCTQKYTRLRTSRAQTTSYWIYLNSFSKLWNWFTTKMNLICHSPTIILCHFIGYLCTYDMRNWHASFTLSWPQIFVGEKLFDGKSLFCKLPKIPENHSL